MGAQAVLERFLCWIALPGSLGILIWALIYWVSASLSKVNSQRRWYVLAVLVKAAEQLYGPGKGEAKRRYVRERMKQSGLEKLGREDLEAAVYQLNQAETAEKK